MEHCQDANDRARRCRAKHGVLNPFLFSQQSDEQMHQHHRWAQATTVLQVAIAMAAIALLTKKKWVEYAMFGAAAAGSIVGVLAMLHI